MNTFSVLIDALIAAAPERRSSIEQLIRDMFMRRKVVLALDMSGFSLSVRRDGILSYLCLIRRMQRLTLPIVVSHQGTLIKHEADNLLAVFDHVDHAAEAALEMLQAATLEPAGDGPSLSFSIGIDYGDILVLDGVDCFGDAVNLAHKLGEDIARPGEILLTAACLEELTDRTSLALHEIPVSFSGVEITAYQVSRAAGDSSEGANSSDRSELAACR